ncbi:MAG: Planctomycete cytochrome, partial [Bryobacterales bacterium]|nr:Planctomycete cytochrome [Bryobacterales bacterium]
NPGPEERLVDDYALASRLSYFLWGSMPDEMMFDLAAMGKLHDPAILKEEVGRMLRSPKSMGFINSFVSQWLGIRELGHEFVPDAKLFPNYASDVELRADIGFQPAVFFHALLSNNESILDLLDSNWTITTKKLAALYKLDITLRKENQEQPHRVELPPGSHRGGLLGMSAVLAVSSYPYRTSPVLRGKWVLDSILGTPPLPPPPNVPSLDAHGNGQAQTIRERLAQHRADPVCGGCHSRIDPLGFALENYDALGQWRTEEAGKPIDNTGELPDGAKFAGPDQLRAVLMQKRDLFVRNLTNRLLGYALGRGLTRQDSCTVDEIVSDLAAKNYKSQSLIEVIVMSRPFRYQAGRAAAPSSKPVSQANPAPNKSRSNQ